MSEIAIIATGGKQYLVRKNDTIAVGKLPQTGKTHEFTDLLSGNPVKTSVILEGRSKKVFVRKFKSKVRFLRKKSHRSPTTVLRVDTIAG